MNRTEHLLIILAEECAALQIAQIMSESVNEDSRDEDLLKQLILINFSPSIH